MITAHIHTTPYQHTLYVSAGADLLFSFYMFDDVAATVPKDLEGAEFEFVVYDALGEGFLLLTEVDGIVVTDNLVSAVIANADFDGLVWGCSYDYRMTWADPTDTVQALFSGKIYLT